jgi:hypothetical protein
MITQSIPKHFLLSLFLTLFFFFPLFWISQYNYPSGDDFGMALLAKELGAFEAAKWWYFNFCGRYSYSYLQSLISISEHWLIIYQAFPVALILAGFGCVYYFVRAFFGREFSRAEAFTLTAILYTLLISFSPDIATAFYWLTTNIQYTGAVFTSLLTFSLWINFPLTKRSFAKAAYVLLIIVLIVLLAGLNEVSTFFFLATLGLINLLHIVKFKRPHKWGLTLLAFSGALALVCYVAPGTYIRLDQAEGNFHFFNIIAGSIGLTFYLLIELLTSTPLLPASIIYLAFLHANRDRLDRPRSLLIGVRWYWILLFMLLTITAANLAVSISLGINGLTDRLKNVYVYSIFFGWLLLLTALFIDLSARKISLHVPQWVLGTLAAVVFGFLLIGYELETSRRNIIPSASRSQRMFSLINTESIYANAYLDILSGRAEWFAQQNEERERQLRNAADDIVEFPLYSYIPKTIFIQDVNHPFGSPDSVSKIISGSVKALHYVETGPPAPVKEKF